ncbi:MAG TPA: c-type cytochrome [Planctomycetes bacterium]|nr:c-type cytochrome [Planctomycetota bacterium]
MLPLLCKLLLLLPPQGPGVLARFQAGQVEDSRTLPRFALYVAAGESPSLFLPAGPFRLRMKASLRLSLRDRFRFALQGRGRATLRVRGKAVLQGPLPAPGEPPLLSKRLRLRKGDNPIEIEFQSPAQGPSQLRLLWQGSDFPLEPLPAHLLSSPPPAQGDSQARAGFQALSQASCLACHPDERLPPSRFSPIFAPRGPDLREARARLRRSWFLAWVQDPRSLRPAARMPRLLRGEDSPSQARDLAAFLGLEEGDPAPAEAELVPKGARLFEELRCASCHLRTSQAPKGSDKIPLAGMGQKFRRGALAAFLRDPAKQNPRSRMPRFPLSSHQAAALAAFLRSGTPILRRAPPAPPGDPARGKALFSRLGCAACHQGPGDPAPSPMARPYLALPPKKSCPRTGGRLIPVPRVPLGAPADELGRILRSTLRCASCHESSATPALPSLTAVGEKLRPSALRALFRGEAPRARPWLKARMPAFSAFAEPLTRGLCAEAGLAPRDPSRPKPEPALLPLGKKLVSNRGGFSCVLCHAVGKTKALQVFEVEGVNFALVPARLRRAFYDRWMWNPQRIDPSSKMPRFAGPEGTTAFTEILEGDAEKQFAAIWAYLTSLKQAR